MRIAGWLLLLIGTLLCVSIVWATIGFLMMGVGLLSLLLAEQARKRGTAAPAAIVAKPTMVAKRPVMPREPSFQPDEYVPALAPPPKPRPATVSRANTVAAAIDKIRQEHSPYDHEKWNALVESDPDLARLVEILTPYGRQYVDELAAAYLTFNDKNYLPVIVDEIVASARRSAGPPRAEDAAVGASDANRVRRGKSAGLRPSRSGDLPGAAGVSQESIAAEPAKVEPDPLQTLAEIVADSSAPAIVVVPATSAPQPARIPTEPVATATPAAAPAAETIGKIDLDDAKDLRELFKQLGSG